MTTRLHVIFFAVLLGLAGALKAQSTAGDMVDIPAGWYLRGDSTDANVNRDAPTNMVYVSDFQIDSLLISQTLWNQVYQWGTGNGYSFSTNGFAFGASHPIMSMSWNDAVKWCNARSEMDGLTPCYYTSTSFGSGTVYRTGNVVLATNEVNWAANGYRLPTEAEWEKAARGTLVANRFPNGNSISHSAATYVSPLVPVSYDAGPVSTGGTSTTPVGTLTPNSFGLYDMAGNVCEFTWDFYSTTYFTSTTTNNPHGPNTGSSRTTRGGNYIEQAGSLRIARRTVCVATFDTSGNGFRCVRANATVVVTQPQSVSFTAGNNLTGLTNSQSISLVASSTSGQQPSFTITNANPSNVATLVGTSLTGNTPGSFTIVASVPGGLVNNVTYAPASASLNFTVTAPSSGGGGVVDINALTALIGNNQISLADLYVVLANFQHTGTVDETALVSFLGSDSVTVPDLLDFLNNYSPNGKVTVAALASVLGATTNTVDQAGVNDVLTHYWSSNPPCITNYGVTSSTNFTFAVTNFTFRVQVSTDLNNWQDVGVTKFQFTDTNAVLNKNSYYRIVTQTNAGN